MHLHFLSLFFLILLLLSSRSLSAMPPSPSPLPDDFAFPSPPSGTVNTTFEFMDPTLPPTLLPTENPKCSLLVLQRDFAHTVGAPPASSNYTPPSDCPAPWSRIVLELSASASGLQQDRIAAVWLNGAEILRTTTPLTMVSGAFWHVRKDITRYTSLLRRDSLFSMMLENSNATFPGIYSVNVSLHFYRGAIAGETNAGRAANWGLAARPTVRSLYREPADLIIPVSREAGDAGGGFWFQVNNETDVGAATVVIPNNTFRAVLEVYVSPHADDECWYANPLRQTSGRFLGASKANGGFRQVFATIDGRFAGSAVPFPVIYPGSINPFFWVPVAAIGAYSHPSYDLDLTPFVGQLLDGQPHEFGLSVQDSQPYWLVDANLHLWLDAWSDAVEGALVRYKVPPLRMSRQAEWKDLDGKSEVEGGGIIRFSGWVSSSQGKVTTSIRHKIKFKSHVVVEEKGATKQVTMESKERTNVRIEMDDAVVDRVLVQTEAPLQMMTTSSNGGGETRIHTTKLFHEMKESRTMSAANKMGTFSTITDRQESDGSVLVQDGEVVWGSGDTKSTYKFRDDKGCYLRTVNMVGGKVKDDEDTVSCASVAES